MNSVTSERHSQTDRDGNCLREFFILFSVYVEMIPALSIGLDADNPNMGHVFLQ